MAEVQIEIEVIDDELPGGTAARVGRWTAAVTEASEDGKVRKVKGIPEDQLDVVRRALSHTASALRTAKWPNGAGVSSRVVDGVLYWQVNEKRVRSASSGTSSPAAAGAEASTGNGAGSTPKAGAKR